MHKFSIYKCLNCSNSDGKMLDLLEISGKTIVLCSKCSNKAKNKPKVNFYPELEDKIQEIEQPKQEMQDEDYVERQPIDYDDYNY